jgi:NAD(P)-dependent dehydrogenase (short-subunit alcohol dehydrogenase family)
MAVTDGGDRARERPVDTSDMTGKTVVVTGANSGIGRETALALARVGARTLITARDPARGRQAAEDIARRAGSEQVELVVFDLGDLGSVRAGAAEILDRCLRLDVLVNNAGLVSSERRETVDGYEMTFAVNHLGPFLLSTLLLDRLASSAPSRIVNVASTSHKGARRGLNFDDLQSSAGYRTMKAYGASKLANVLFTAELARRLEGTGVTANCCHPGTVATGWGHDGDTKGLLALGLKAMPHVPFILTPEQGARTSVYLATSAEVAEVSGGYFVGCRQKRPSSAAGDASAARRLYEVSEQLVAAPA